MDYKAARHHMVVSQLKTNHIKDEKTLHAFAKVEREDFLPAPLKDMAYIDEDLSIGEGRVLMEPLIAAHYIQAAALEEDDEVLIIAAGTGYETALVCEFTNSVIAVEENIMLRKKAEEVLSEKSLNSVAFLASPNKEGALAQAPFDVILILGAVETLPAHFIEQLREGGRLIYIEREGEIGRLKKVIKTKEAITEVYIRDAQTLILPSFENEELFSF